MDFRVPDTLDSSDPVSTGESSEIQFAEFTGDAAETPPAEAIPDFEDGVEPGMDPPDPEPQDDSPDVVNEAGTEPPPLPASGKSSPSRLSRRKALLEEMKRRKKAAVVLGIETEEEEEEPPKNWREWLVRWLKGKEARSVYTSFAFHFALLLCLSLFLITQLNENDAISMTMNNENTVPVEFEVVDFSFDSAEANTAPQLQKVEQESTESVFENDLDEMFKRAGSGEGTGDEGFGFAFKMPTGGQVVRKGSFAAWTVPKDPRPNEDYKIVIQIQVPKTITRYRMSDLSGRVVGTDKYTLDIPNEIQFNRYGTRIQKTRTGNLEFVKRNDFARVIDNQVQVIVTVEGAKQLVRDTIELRSRMLKEEQKLEIEF